MRSNILKKVPLYSVLFPLLVLTVNSETNHSLHCMIAGSFPPSVVSVRIVPPSDVNVPEEGGFTLVCTEIVSGTLAPGVTATVTLATSDGSAQREETILAVVCAGRLLSKSFFLQNLLTT